MTRRFKVFSLFLLTLVMILTTAPAYADSGGAQTPLPYIDLTPLFQVLIGLLATLITTKAVPWFNARTNAQQQQNAAAMVRTFVFAAEQMYKTQSGDFKRKYVEDQLRRAGFTVDRNEIEAAVREMNWGGLLDGGVGEVNVAEDVNIDSKPPGDTQ